LYQKMTKWCSKLVPKLVVRPSAYIQRYIVLPQFSNFY
jgi:hypothetical protein